MHKYTAMSTPNSDQKWLFMYETETFMPNWLIMFSPPPTAVAAYVPSILFLPYLWELIFTGYCKGRTWGRDRESLSNMRNHSFWVVNYRHSTELHWDVLLLLYPWVVLKLFLFSQSWNWTFLELMQLVCIGEVIWKFLLLGNEFPQWKNSTLQMKPIVQFGF